MPTTTIHETPRAARFAAGLSALAFFSAAVSWGMLATMGLWAPSQYRLEPQLHDVIPGVIAACMLLIALQFARGVMTPAHLPMGKRLRPISVGRFGVRLTTAALFGFMGFVLLNMSAKHADFAIFDARDKVVGIGDPQFAWMPIVQEVGGFLLILVACLAIVTHTRQFFATRSTAAPRTAAQNG